MERVTGFEQWAAMMGAGRADIGDAGTHRASERISRKQWQRIIRAQRARAADVLERRERLRAEYAALMAAGELGELSAGERLRATAGGHEDNGATQAARRVLAKRAARLQARI